MYFPYFRGRQYELLALKELVNKQLISQKVIPVIEPIKISSTFISTLQVFSDNNLKLGLVLNPQVGKLIKEPLSLLLDSISDTVIPSVIFNSDADYFIQNLDEHSIGKESILAILDNADYIASYKDVFSEVSPLYTLTTDERNFRRRISHNKVLFKDYFEKQQKNADYEKKNDEPFSEDHKYYRDEGFVGFGDYSIIGNNYEEGGFLPRAVAIHIVYFDEESALRIHHFVSDSNFGTEDVAGKYYEAVNKLKQWFCSGYENQKTSALSILLEHADNGYYPGLPTIKKLSIMHHLELMSRYLEGNL
ncbi:MAG: sce7725 family protein [Clostridia bacterium]|nr:sce7725 family protein [Clostridia bacterium]